MTKQNLQDSSKNKSKTKRPFKKSQPIQEVVSNIYLSRVRNWVVNEQRIKFDW